MKQPQGSSDLGGQTDLQNIKTGPGNNFRRWMFSYSKQTYRTVSEGEWSCHNYATKSFQVGWSQGMSCHDQDMWNVWSQKEGSGANRFTHWVLKGDGGGSISEDEESQCKCFQGTVSGPGRSRVHILPILGSAMSHVRWWQSFLSLNSCKTCLNKKQKQNEEKKKKFAKKHNKKGKTKIIFLKAGQFVPVWIFLCNCAVLTTNCWRRNLIWSVSSMIAAACQNAVVDVFCSVCSPCGQWCTFVILSDRAGGPTCPLVWRACVHTTARPWPLSWQGGPAPGHRGRGVAICLPPTQVTYPFSCSHLFWLCCGSSFCEHCQHLKLSMAEILQPDPSVPNLVWFVTF